MVVQPSQSDDGRAALRSARLRPVQMRRHASAGGEPVLNSSSLGKCSSRPPCLRLRLAHVLPPTASGAGMEELPAQTINSTKTMERQCARQWDAGEGQLLERTLPKLLLCRHRRAEAARSHGREGHGLSEKPIATPTHTSSSGAAGTTQNTTS